MAGGQLGSKSPNLQSPSNISVSKPMGVVESLSLGSLPSSISSSAMSIPNSAGLQSMSGNVMSIANNGSSAQVLSSIPGMLLILSQRKNIKEMFLFLGMNNTGASGGMIMTNSNMSAMSGAMGGGGLVVSSSINKQPLPAAGVNMLAPGQHHAANHGVSQVSKDFILLKYL